jgi:hypothetical protein
MLTAPPAFYRNPNQDAAALKTAWAQYFKTAKLDQTNPFSTRDPGQGISSDFSPFVKNSRTFSIDPLMTVW